MLTLVEDLLTTALAARSSPAADTLVDAVLQTLPWVRRSHRVTFLDDTCSHLIQGLDHLSQIWPTLPRRARGCKRRGRKSSRA